jgi:hypothetical protein
MGMRSNVPQAVLVAHTAPLLTLMPLTPGAGTLGRLCSGSPLAQMVATPVRSGIRQMTWVLVIARAGHHR